MDETANRKAVDRDSESSGTTAAPEPAGEPEPSVPPLPEWRVHREMPCGRCGYILKSLPSSGYCPECREPVRSTLAAGAGAPRPMSAWDLLLLLSGAMALSAALWLAIAVLDRVSAAWVGYAGAFACGAVMGFAGRGLWGR